MASRRFGLSISLKKTEVLFQPSPDNIYATPVVIDNTTFPVAETLAVACTAPGRLMMK